MSHCALSQNESEMKVKLKHTRQQTGRKKTQQMNADWPVYQESCTQVMLCYYRTEAKRRVEANKKLPTGRRGDNRSMNLIF